MPGSQFLCDKGFDAYTVCSYHNGEFFNLKNKPTTRYITLHLSSKLFNKIQRTPGVSRYFWLISDQIQLVTNNIVKNISWGSKRICKSVWTQGFWKQADWKMCSILSVSLVSKCYFASVCICMTGQKNLQCHSELLFVFVR